MSHTRLNYNHRSTLLQFMFKVVSCPAEAKAEDALYTRAKAIATKAVEQHYPAADMAVLSKYNCTERMEKVRIQLTDLSIICFQWRKDEAPLIADDYGAENRIFLANTQHDSILLDKWNDAHELLRVALKQKRTDYTNFINSAATFEQILETWPEAAAVADRIKTNLPAAISPEILARIQADSKKRMHAV